MCTDIRTTNVEIEIILFVPWPCTSFSMFGTDLQDTHTMMGPEKPPSSLDRSNIVEAMPSPCKVLCGKIRGNFSALTLSRI